MKFSEDLFDEVKEIWDEYLKHPFVKGIGEGTLDKEKFKNYLNSRLFIFKRLC